MLASGSAERFDKARRTLFAEIDINQVTAACWMEPLVRKYGWGAGGLSGRCLIMQSADIVDVYGWTQPVQFLPVSEG